MSYSFNLVDEPWIPCTMFDGRSLDLSLKELLAQASEVREIRASSPLVTVALHRLVLAILHCNFGPAGIEDWLAIWNNSAGIWDVPRVHGYLNRHREGFELFHPTRPFYQVADLAGTRTSPVARLYHELSSGNNATLFNHSLDGAPASLGAAEAARMLVTQQAFAVGGGKSPTGYLKDAPLIRGVVVLLTGNNLFETLMLNLIEYNPEYDVPIPAGRNDLPAWERGPIDPGATRVVDGYLDLLTWQSRAIRLLPEGDPGDPGVSKLYYAQGESMRGDPPDDPQLPMVDDSDGGYKRLRLRRDRALWRDSTALMNRNAPKPVRALNLVAQLIAYHGLDASADCRLSAFGLAVRERDAKILLWREEALPLPFRYLQDQQEGAQLFDLLAGELQKAEDGSSAINRALYTLAVHLLYPSDDSRARGVDRKRVRALIAEFETGRIYWSRLELHFDRLVRDLVVDREGARRHWTGAVRSEARTAFDMTVRGVERSARSLKATTRARAALNGELAQRLGGEGVVWNVG
ncbi:MAG: type I-E CRISPR-associated protein Cse1/CasA [Actinobacteria bacterium]|nr:type I-E CRISPR-associated protein Cse1/CasA [Actinomycetota bacterium]